MTTVAITVDCEAAITGKCYTRELIRVAEEYTIPLTWLIYVSEKDSMSNINLYHNEYLHRIPNWHEEGLLLKFENSNGYISDPKERADLIRLGKDVLKTCHVKPTAFRAADFDLLSEDVKALEDIGILVDASACFGALDKQGVSRPDGPRQPYHPSYSEIGTPGDAKLLSAPLATYQGVCGYLDQGWDKVGQVVENSLKNFPVTVLALSDDVDDVDVLRKAIEAGKNAEARFVTLTQLATIC
jgi:hypothetical protein